MPAATNKEGQSGFASLQQLQASLGEIASEVDAERSDFEFLKKFLEDPVIETLVQAQDRLEQEPEDTPSEEPAARIVADVLNNLGSSPEGEELDRILSDPHFQGLVTAYDDVADKNFDDEPPDHNQLHAPPPPIVFNAVADQVRLVGIRKDPNSPLGITVKIDEHSDLIIARIMKDSMIDKQGLLHVGDIIKEVNGIPVASPEQLMDIIRFTEGSITLKIVPTLQDQQPQSQKFMKANFSYDPQKDRLIPCKDAGLKFQDGDILQILSVDNDNWWQARIVGKEEDGRTGLIPSQSLEEKRKAFVQPDYDFSKSSLLCGLKRRKKKKINFATKNTAEFDRCDLAVYEEVARMPPFKRKSLILVGANGVGRRSLKERLLKSDPHRFGAVMPHTCRAPREGEVHGKGYFFEERAKMEEDIRNGLYLEYGEYNGNLYGTKIDSIDLVTKAGKMCVLDVNPTSLKILKTADYMPYIVFVAAPSAEALKRMYDEGRRRGLVVKRGFWKRRKSFRKQKRINQTVRRLKSRDILLLEERSGSGTVDLKTEEDYRKTVEESAQIERVYKGMFDMTLVNDDFDDAYDQLRKAIDDLGTEPQWVPIRWVY